MKRKARKMADGIQHCDVLIDCALEEEAAAVEDEFSRRCNVSFQTAFSTIDRYRYRYATIQNRNNELLTILLISQARPGPLETGDHLKPLLQEFCPRFAAMTGICAGDKRKVKLGDLIVAEYAYHYEEGNVGIDRSGEMIHHPEWITHGTAKRILQYVHNFKAWEEPVAELKRLKMKHELKGTEWPKRFIAPMASGMAVRSDDPFLELQPHNRKTLALDQEAAAFYRTLHEFSHIYALVVKGVCDYADPTKNDTYHKYAAQASAIYLLYFLKEYVTDETMPRRDDHQSQNQAGPPYQVGLQNNSSGDITIKQSQVNIAGRNIYHITYPRRELRAFQWVGSRRLLLASLAGLALAGGGIAWATLSQRSLHTRVGLGSLLYTYHGHSNWVTAVTWSPDSERIASASADKTVQVWDARNGEHIYIYPGHSDFVYAVAWSPDGTRIASGSTDGLAQVWDPTDNRRRITTYRGHTNAEFGVQSLTWSPNGTRIASAGSDGTVQIWDAGIGGQLFTHPGHAFGENAVAWSPLDGKYIAFGSSDSTVQVWDATNGRLINTYRGHSQPVHAVAWSPDGKRIVSGSWDSTIRMWDVALGKPVHLYNSDVVNAIAWSPDGTLIASGEGFPQRGTVQVWGAE